MSQQGRRVLRAATLVMGLFVVSRVLGLVRQTVIGAMFGTSGNLDAYVAAARVPEMVFMVVAGGALGSAFIPTFAEYLAAGDRSGAWRMASAVTNLVVLGLTVTSAAMALFAPVLVRSVIAPGFGDSKQALTVSLLRVLSISSVVFGVSGVLMGALNAHHHFLLPALAPSLYNLAIIGGTLVLGPHMGVMGMAIAANVGALLHLLIQIPGLVRCRARYSATLGLDSPGVREVGRLMLPRVFGMAVVQVNFIVNNSLGSLMGEGAVSVLTYAWLIMTLPQGVFAQAVGTAAFPTFATQAAQEEYADLRSTLAATLRAVVVLSLPATVGLIVLSRPIVALLFERGAFGASSTEAVAWALRLYALGLVGYAGLEILARVFYALHDTFTPVLVGAAAVAGNILLSVTLSRLFEAMGWARFGALALANSLAVLAEVGALYAFSGRRLGQLDGRQMPVTIVKCTIASLMMGAVLLLWRAASAGQSLLLQVVGGAALGLLTFALAAYFLRMEEAQRVADLLARRTRKPAQPHTV